MTVHDLKYIQKKGQLVKAAREVAQQAEEICRGCVVDISGTSLDGSAPDDTDLLLDIFNVPDAVSDNLRRGLREIYSSFLMDQSLVITVVFHNSEDTERYYSERVREIQDAPEVISWLAERYDSLLKRAV